jgi:uncharacterized protein YigE (DUF2233 family)
MKLYALFLILFLTIVPQSLPKRTYIDGYTQTDRFVLVKIDPKESHLAMYYKNKYGEVLGDFYRLSQYVKHQGRQLVFACNGGMFMEDLRPLGLYIENGVQIMPLNTRSASTNFYIKPNGVFYICSNGKAGICKTEEYKLISGMYTVGEDIKYATQSGGMLTINGEINPKFDPNSLSWKYRNGVGIQDDGKVVFILSKEPVSFYCLAAMFQACQCNNSLFLDGDISDFYCPEIGYTQMFGYMSVMIAVTN